MTNFEYWKDRILEINECENVAIIYGKPIKCTSIEKCEECEFHTIGKTCRQKFVEWLYSEHEEKPKLTKQERMLCELMKTGWIARDENKRLDYHQYKPHKSGRIWRSIGSYFFFTEFANAANATFDFIKFEDSEPWSVEDLLKLEVEE